MQQRVGTTSCPIRRTGRPPRHNPEAPARTLPRSGWTDMIAIAAVVLLVFSAVLADRGRSSIERSATEPGYGLAAATPGSASTEEAPAPSMYRGNAARTGEMPGPGPTGVLTLACTRQFEEPTNANLVSADSRVFYAKYSEQTGTLDFIAADLETGEELWTAPIDVDSGSVPAVADGIVYVNTTSGLKAIEASTGDVVWTFPGGEATTSISPVAHDDGVYDTGSGYSMTALDASDGTRLWSVPLPGTVPGENYLGFLTHIAVSGELIFGRSAEGTVSAFDIRNGEAVWTTTFEGSAEETFLVSDGVVAVTAFVLEPETGPHPVRLHALDAASGEPLWEPVELTSPSSLAAAEGTLFVAGSLEDTGTVTAYDIQTGEPEWTSESGGDLQSPIYVDGQLYVPSSGDGTIRRMDAANGTVNWSVYLGANGDALVADGLVLVTGDGTLYAVGGDDGQGTPPPSEKPRDLSGLPPCEPPRMAPDEPLTGDPSATVDTETRVLEPIGDPGRTADSRPVESTTWPQMLTENVPNGTPASAEQIAGVRTTLDDIGDCSRRPEGQAQTPGFFSDDFFRRGIVTPGSGDPLIWNIQPDEEQLNSLDVFVLEDGRVAASTVSDAGYGTFLVFLEEGGALLVDEVHEVRPEYFEGPLG